MGNITREQYQLKVEKTYEFIKQYLQEHNYSPSLREITEGTNSKSIETIFNHLRILRDENRIDFIDGKARTIRIK